MNLKFLIVEDEPLTARFTQKILEKENFIVVGIARNAEEAKRIVEDNQVDVILMDINIDGPEDGIQLAHNLKTKNSAIIYTSAYSDKSTLIEAAKTKPYGFIVKPFNENDLLAAVHICIGRLNDERLITDQVGNGLNKFRLDTEKNLLLSEDETVVLTKNETRCLEYLFLNNSRKVSKIELIHAIWGDEEFTNESALRELLTRLRKKIHSFKIVNIYGKGYYLQFP